MCLLMVTMVFANGPANNEKGNIEKEEKNMTRVNIGGGSIHYKGTNKTVQVEVNKTKENKAQEQPKIQNKERVEVKLKGIENAITRVKNNETRQHLEQVMNKIQEKRRETLNKLENLIIEKNEENKYVAVGKTKAKLFGFIKMNKKVKFEITEEGVMKRKRMFWDWLFNFPEEVEE